MMFPTLLFLFLATAVSATPLSPPSQPRVFSLAFAAHLNASGTVNIVAADRARAHALKTHGSARTNGSPKRDNNVPVTDTAVVYTANVGIGNPATQYTLLIDTGSGNTWIGASKPYVITGTSMNTGQTVSVTTGAGSITGKEYIDRLTLSPTLIVLAQSIGVGSPSTISGISGVDGVLGLGPTGSTQGTLSGGGTVNTVTDNLYIQKTIPTDSVSFYYAPSTNLSSINGELTFGGVDTTKINGTLSYVPITSTYPASQYWGVNQSVNYGGTSVLSSTAGIVDSGTTLVLIATNAFNAYKTATGATLDSATGLLKITSAQYSALKTLNFVIGGVTYGLTPNAQIWPRTLNTYIGGSSSSIYLIVNDLGSNSGEGLDFINGFTFLERFYTVFDTSNKRVGFAPTPLTLATTN